MKPASTTKEKRVALDLLDVREGIEYFKDSIRWVPTDHMLVDSLTKSMPPTLLNRYMRDYLYSFKYDEELRSTKREAAKERKRIREERLKQGGNKQKTPTCITESTPVGAHKNACRERERDSPSVFALVSPQQQLSNIGR